MPTEERAFSKELNVSRNTISTAYNQLESNGVLKSIQGKRHFCCRRSYIMEESRS